MLKFTGNLRLDFEKATAEITKLKDRVLGYQEQIVSLQASVRNLKRSKESDKKQYMESLAEKDAIIKELQNRLAHAEALLNHDGSNTGTPTSQTPINKNKVIPNSRRSTGKSKGGQIGHTKVSLEAPDESEITDTVGHPLQDDECCPKCGLTDCLPTGESEVKYEYDVRIKVVKIKHEFFYYECNNCGTVFRSQIPPSLKEKVQCGSGLQAFALSLTNTVNAAMNKASMFLAGITGGELTPCEGYIAKLQARAAKGLRQFREDLKLVLITRKIVYWDDTIIFILAKRACFRFYGDEFIAYYTAHAHKDKESLDDDNVLNLLTSATKAMHDHNTVNYNGSLNRKLPLITMHSTEHISKLAAEMASTKSMHCSVYAKGTLIRLQKSSLHHPTEYTSEYRVKSGVIAPLYLSCQQIDCE